MVAPENNNAMNIQHQNWLGFDRALITTEGASVILDMYPHDRYKQIHNGNSDCYLWSLWVEEEYRGKGIAGQLIAEAERYAALHGCKVIALEHDSREAPNWVRKWYNRLGFQGAVKTDHSVLMTKKLKDPKQQ